MRQGNTRQARLLLRIASITNALMLLPVCCEATLNNTGIWLVMLLPLGFLAFALMYATDQRLWFEMAIERTWKRVCVGIGFKSEARSYRNGLVGAYGKGETKIITPRLRDVHGTYEAWTGEATFFDGQTVEEYTKNSDAFALSFNVPFVTFEKHENGLITVRAGKVPVPSAYDYSARVQVKKTLDNKLVARKRLSTASARRRGTVSHSVYERGTALRKVADDSSQVALHSDAQVVEYKHRVPDVVENYERVLELLKAVPMARDINGSEFAMPIEGQHWFIAARTGGGKGSWIWSLVLGLAPAWKAGLVKFWGIDPKMIELAIGRDWWDYYADDDVSSVELLEKCVEDMKNRLRQMQGVSRKFTPSPETPLNVVVVDEMGYLSVYMTDKKLQARAHSAIATILSKGRAPGYAFVGLLQDPRKETCSFRDLFSIRVAGGLPAPMVDLVLGDGMRDAGAFCDQLPINEPGVAYVLSQETQMPLKVRAAWCDDRAIQNALNSRDVASVNDSEDVKDESLTGQLGFDGQPLQQWKYKVE